jgi:hypothetical protein
MAIKTSFEQLWAGELEAKARAAGAIDGDIPRIRSAAKNLLISAGWAETTGECHFLSDGDKGACLTAAAETIERTTGQLVSERNLVRATTQPGFSPTKTQVLAGSAQAAVSAGVETMVLESVQQVSAGSFTPACAKLGDRCPRCSGSMETVGLVNDKASIYCTRDRVVLPLSSDYSMRY